MVVGSFALTPNRKRRATYKYSTDMDTEAATKVFLFCYYTNSSSSFFISCLNSLVLWDFWVFCFVSISLIIYSSAFLIWVWFIFAFLLIISWVLRWVYFKLSFLLLDRLHPWKTKYFCSQRCLYVFLAFLNWHW